MPRYASSTDVARMAGVSQSTVSRTYRSGTSVSPGTRERVLAAAETLGYRPSMIPQIMLNHRSYLVALVIGGMYNPFYARVLEEFTVRLHSIGHQILLVHVDSGHTFDKVISRLAGYRVDAIVSALAVLSLEAADELARFKIPVVSFNTPVKNEWVSSISSDNERAGGEIADLFIARGARTFGYIAGPSDSPANEDRLAGFRERLVVRGFPEPAVIPGDFHYEDGYEAVRALIGKGNVPDALFCANDLLAVGAMDALRGEGHLRIPEDVIVAGFDDIPMAAWRAYDLTTFVQDATLLVDETLRILDAAAEANAPLGELHVVLPARLIERGSTRPGSALTKNRSSDGSKTVRI